MTYLLALDQGTSSSRAILYDSTGRPLAQAQDEIAMAHPEDGWVEQDPEEIWTSILSSARAVLEQHGAAAKDVVGIGITNQRETTLVWDRQTGAAVYPAIVWQDRRTAERCAELRQETIVGQALPDFISERTGLLIDPYFSATKLAWILDHVPDARARAERGELCFGTVDSYLIWRLTGGRSHVTDATNASRTMLFDIREQTWIESLLEQLSIPQNMLPDVKNSADDFGMTDADLLGASVPILGVAGDQQAALIGQGCFERGQTKSTYGTGCFVMANTGAEQIASSQQLLATIAYRLDGETTYALEGSIFVAGVAIKWIRDQLRLIDDAADTSAAFERTGGDAGGVVVVPALTGLGAPYWRPEARGMITGLTLDTNRDQLVTAVLQAVVYQTEELLRAMARDGAPVASIRVDGGMVVNDQLCQFLADILDVPVERPVDVETTALGAALLAGLGAGLFPDITAAADAWRCERGFESQMANADRQRLLSGYAQAVRQVLAGVDGAV